MVKKIFIAMLVLSSVSAFAVEFTCKGMYGNFGEVAIMQIDGKDATFFIQYNGSKINGTIKAAIGDWYVTRVTSKSRFAELNIERNLVVTGKGVVTAYDLGIVQDGKEINTWFFCNVSTL